MNIFVDGFQNTGKTTLLEGSKYNSCRFPFNQYLDAFNLKTKEELNGFQIGKDLGILFALNYSTTDIQLFDRGPFSTLYYSLKENRWDGDMIRFNNFLSVLAKAKNCRYVFVYKRNGEGITREHNDGFDYLNDDEDPNKYGDLERIRYLAAKKGIKLYLFENDFSQSIEENVKRFDNLIETIIREAVHEHN